MKKNKTTYMAGGIGNEAYEASVIARALDRAGNCSQLKGHIHEIMYCDLYNLANAFNGNSAQLTKSAIAPVKDVIATGSNGRVVMHGQFKDTISNSGIHKTANQIMSGKYGKTTVYGTEETAREVNRVLDVAGKTKQRVQSSGISSETTSRIATKGLSGKASRVVNKGVGATATVSAVANAAKAGGVAGAVVSGGIEAISSFCDVINGEKEFGDAVIDTAGATVKGGITGAGSGAAGYVGTMATGIAVESLVSTGFGATIGSTAIGAVGLGLAPLAVGIGAAWAVGSFITSFFDE